MSERQKHNWMNCRGDLTAAMDNVLASRLGKVVRSFETEFHSDGIDRGLVLRRRLEEAGFSLQYIGEPLPESVAHRGNHFSDKPAKRSTETRAEPREWR